VKSILIRAFATAVIVGFLSDSQVSAIALKGRATAIYVENMHCKNCAKNIARKLYAVPGVVAVHADVKKNLALVTPQRGKDPSPKAMWEATKAAKHKPVKLIGPFGTYVKQPNR